MLAARQPPRAARADSAIMRAYCDKMKATLAAFSVRPLRRHAAG